MTIKLGKKGKITNFCVSFTAKSSHELFYLSFWNMSNRYTIIGYNSKFTSENKEITSPISVVIYFETDEDRTYFLLKYMK